MRGPDVPADSSSLLSISTTASAADLVIASLLPVIFTLSYARPGTAP
jgi:hypothetical protein